MPNQLLREEKKIRNTVVFRGDNKYLSKIVENETDKRIIREKETIKIRETENKADYKHSQKTIMELPFFTSVAAKKLLQTSSFNLNELKFLKNLKTINSIKSGIHKTNQISSSSLIEDSKQILIGLSKNNVDNTSTIYNQNPDLNEMTSQPINSLKKLNLADIEDVESKLILNSNSRSKSNSKSSLEFSIKKRYKVEKSLNNLYCPKSLFFGFGQV